MQGYVLPDILGLRYVRKVSRPMILQKDRLTGLAVVRFRDLLIAEGKVGTDRPESLRGLYRWMPLTTSGVQKISMLASINLGHHKFTATDVVSLRLSPVVNEMVWFFFPVVPVLTQFVVLAVVLPCDCLPAHMGVHSTKGGLLAWREWHLHSRSLRAARRGQPTGWIHHIIPISVNTASLSCEGPIRLRTLTQPVPDEKTSSP